VLRRIFELKMEEVVGCWRRLHEDKHHNLYATSQGELDGQGM